MPYVHLSIPNSLNEAEVNELREAMASLMPILPTKTRENTMIHIEPGCHIALGNPEPPCLFLEARLYQASPWESKQQFVREISALLEQRLGVPQSRMYINLIELEHWGAGGVYS